MIETKKEILEEIMKELKKSRIKMKIISLLFIIFFLTLLGCTEKSKESRFSPLETAIACENIGLIERFINTVEVDSIKQKADLILNGQKALSTGVLEDLNISIYVPSHSKYEKEIIEIYNAIQESSTPRILEKAKSLSDKGDVFNLFKTLIEIQTIIDNTLLRHLLAQLLFESACNFPLPQSAYELSNFQSQMTDLEELFKDDNRELSLGSFDENLDFGNVMIGISTTTILARCRDSFISIAVEAIMRGVDSFDEISNYVGVINSVVIKMVFKMLENYPNIDIKARYATLQWIDYLIERIEYGKTLQVGRIDKKLKKTVSRENNKTLELYGKEILQKLQD